VLTWTGGTAQAGYLVLRLGGPTPVVVAALDAPATTFADLVPFAQTVACYAVVVRKNDTEILGLSDLLCVFPQTGTITGPSNPTIALNQSHTAQVTWTAPALGPGAGYVLAPLGTDRWQMLGLTATSAVDPTGGAPTCYLVAVRGDPSSTRVTGTSDIVCGVPGVSFGL
jgi:hypothetical protein